MKHYHWAKLGDINAFFGLMLDNVTNLVIFSTILIGIFKFPKEIVLYKMIPGTAIGVLVGDLIYTWMAFRLAKKTGKDDITAMPLGIDTPSTFALAFTIFGPVYLETHNAELTWHIGMAVLILMGVTKIVTSFIGNWIRKIVPRSALLGSVAGVAILLIAFIPFIQIFSNPLVGFISLGFIILTLIAKIRLPFQFPGALAGVLAGIVVYYIINLMGLIPLNENNLVEPVQLRFSFPYPTLKFIYALDVALKFLPLAIPFAIATVIGGIDVTESASAAGDEYNTKHILLTEGFATTIAGLFGGVLQNTPYIGHPAYKAMGGRAGYTLATALFIGLGGIFGFLSVIVKLIPESAIAPILVFIGLEIMAQAFTASPKEHAKAVAITFIPTIAYLLQIEFGMLISNLGKTASDLYGNFILTYKTINILGNGFILTALFWGGCLASILDKDFKVASVYMLLAGLASLFGIIHSPLPNGELFLPWKIGTDVHYYLFLSYIMLATLFYIFSRKKTL